MIIKTENDVKRLEIEKPKSIIISDMKNLDEIIDLNNETFKYLQSFENIFIIPYPFPSIVKNSNLNIEKEGTGVYVFDQISNRYIKLDNLDKIVENKIYILKEVLSYLGAKRIDIYYNEKEIEEIKQDKKKNIGLGLDIKEISKLVKGDVEVDFNNEFNKILNKIRRKIIRLKGEIKRGKIDKDKAYKIIKEKNLLNDELFMYIITASETSKKEEKEIQIFEEIYEKISNITKLKAEIKAKAGKKFFKIMNLLLGIDYNYIETLEKIRRKNIILKINVEFYED